MYRQVHTKMWQDSWFFGLTSDEKLIWINLFTNDKANVAGIYERPHIFMSVETKIEYQYCIDTLSSFQEQGKILYSGDIIWVKALRKYNESKSPKVQKGILNIFHKIPEGSVKTAYGIFHEIYPMDTVSIPDRTETETETETERSKNPPNPPMGEAKKPECFLCKGKLFKWEIGWDEEFGSNTCAMCCVIGVWGRQFPHKAQPRRQDRDLRKKFYARAKKPLFRDKIYHALERAAPSDLLHKKAWFNFGWLVKNDNNWLKCLDGNYDNDTPNPNGSSGNGATIGKVSALEYLMDKRSKL